MTNINLNWNRWIFASVSVHFKNVISANNLVFVAEGQNRIENGDYIELRMVGPSWTQQSKRLYKGQILINLLVHCMRDEKDFHKIYKMAGITESAFVSCIPIKKYGNKIGVDDSNIQIGQLILADNNGKDINTIHYGQIVPDLPILETTVEAIFETELVIE